MITVSSTPARITAVRADIHGRRLHPDHPGSDVAASVEFVVWFNVPDPYTYVVFILRDGEVEVWDYTFYASANISHADWMAPHLIEPAREALREAVTR